MPLLGTFGNISSAHYRSSLRRGEITISSVTSNEDQNGEITIPDDQVAGDLGILIDYVYAWGNPSSIPSGWTRIGGAGYHYNTSPWTLNMSYRIFPSSVPGTIITGNDSLFGNGRYLLILRKDGLGDWAIGNLTQQATSSSPSNQVMSVISDPYAIIAVYAADSDIDTYGFSPSGTSYTDPTGDNIFRIRTKIYNSSGSSTTISMGDSGSANLLSSFRVWLPQ